MKTQIHLARWLAVMLVMILVINSSYAQPYPIPGDHVVCLNTTEPYGVIETIGSTYVWTILPGTGGAGTIAAGVTQNLITVNWTSPGTCTLQVIETSADGCEGDPVTILITVQPLNTILLTSAVGTDDQTVCINTPILDITYATTGATGATFTGLPTGVTGAWLNDVVTISGTPSVNGVFPYEITLTGGCGLVTITGTITVTEDNTIVLTSAVGTDDQTVCINTPILDITYATTGATGATFTGLPTGVTGAWLNDVVTISGTPSVNGVFPYEITLTGGCGLVTITGTITVTEDNTIVLTSAVGTDDQTVCINTPIIDITYSTTGATGATFTGLPTGVTGAWLNDVVTISGIPSVNGVFPYEITLTGGCGLVTITGTITVTENNTIVLTSAIGTDDQSVCIDTPIIDITYATTGATGATITGLPAGVTGSWAADVVTITGTPSVSGLFSYTITLTGGCGTVTETGTIEVTPRPVTSPIFHN
jgi:hypothetical protein